MKYAEIREKSEAELNRLLADTRDEIQDLRFKIAARQLSNVSSVNKAKTLVARILTEQARRAKAEAPSKESTAEEANA